MITLNPIEAVDLPRVAEIADRAFGSGGRDVAWVEGKCARHRVLLGDSRIARLDGEAVGYALVGYPHALGAEVASIAVVPGTRRRGVGRALLEDAGTAAGRRGQEWLWLRLDEANVAATACAQATGFEVARREPTWEATLPEEPPLSFLDNVVFREMEEPLEMYDWYDALPVPFNDASFEEYQHSPGRPEAFRATRHGETIAAAYVLHAPDGHCRLAKLRLAEIADWVPEFLGAAARPGQPLAVTDPSGRYGQWLASWGYAPGPARVWMRRRVGQ